MDEFFSSGHIVDVILAVIALEVLVVPRWSRRSGRRVARFGMMMAALPGVFLLLALRSALVGAGWIWVAGFLALSFPAHLIDLWRRSP